MASNPDLPSPNIASPLTPGRPRRQTRRPSRFQDEAFETQFVPSQRGKRETQPQTDISVIRLTTMSHDDARFKRLISPRAFCQKLQSASWASIRLVSPRQFSDQWKQMQHNPDQSNSRLPVRLASPMNFYREWIQQGKVPPDRTPSVPVNAQPNRPVKVELDDGDVRDELPASAIGVQAASMPADLTGSNPEDRGEFASVSPIVSISDVQLMWPMADGISAPISQAGEPFSRIVQADTGMSASNQDRRPDDDRFVYHPRDEAIDNNVRVAQIRGDFPVSHNGVPVTSESYNDVRASNTEVRVQGASPPAVQEVLRKGTKGRTSSTPSTKFVYAYTRRSDTASSRSTTSSLSEKSNSAKMLGCNRIFVSNSDGFDKGNRPDSRLSATPNDFLSPSRLMPSQFDFFMSSAGCEFDKVEFCNNPAPVIKPPAIIAFDQPNCTMEPEFSVITGLTTHPARAKFASDRQRPKSSEFDPSIVRQNRIEMHQSAASVSDQSATPPVGQWQPRVWAKADQSEAARSDPDCYKSSCSRQFDITAISEIGENTSAAISTDDNSTSNYNTTGSFQSHLTTISTDLTSAMTRTKQTSRREREDRYPRAVRPYVCGACGHESSQSTNHRRHMLAHHAMRPDGTQTTAEEIAQARGWNTAGHERRKAASSTAGRPSSTAE